MLDHLRTHLVGRNIIVSDVERFRFPRSFEVKRLFHCAATASDPMLETPSVAERLLTDLNRIYWSNEHEIIMP
jgi:hypothetical protein